VRWATVRSLSSTSDRRARRCLAAKPIIDVDLSVADPCHKPSNVPDHQAVGFQLRPREPAWHEHRLVVADDPRANIHVFGTNSRRSCAIDCSETG
jgi:hypothetical protein